MADDVGSLGRTIQLFLVNGTPGGLIVASIRGWTGSVLVGTQTTFAALRARPESDRTGVYILSGQDPHDPLKTRAYIGEADSVKDRISLSAESHPFWETAVTVTTSDETLTKGHVRYLEARLIDMALQAGRVSLDNIQIPASEKRRLPEADRADMEAFLENLRVILPVVGLDLLRPQPKAIQSNESVSISADIKFEIQHQSGIVANAVEEGGEFIVLAGSKALKDAGYKFNAYAELKEMLVQNGTLVSVDGDSHYAFAKPFAFKSVFEKGIPARRKV